MAIADEKLLRFAFAAGLELQSDVDGQGPLRILLPKALTTVRIDETAGEVGIAAECQDSVSEDPGGQPGLLAGVSIRASC